MQGLFRAVNRIPQGLPSIVAFVFATTFLLACAGASSTGSSSGSSSSSQRSSPERVSAPDIDDCWEDCDDAWGNGCNELYGAACSAKEQSWRSCKNTCCRIANPDSFSASDDAFCRGGF